MQGEGAQGHEAGGSGMWENNFKKLQDLWLTQAEHKSRRSGGSQGLSRPEALAKINSLETELKKVKTSEAIAKQELEKANKRHTDEISYSEKLLGGVNWQAKIERLEADLKESKTSEAQAQKELKDLIKRHDEKLLYKDKQLRIVTGNLTETQAKISSLELSLDKAKRSETRSRRELELAHEIHKAAILDRDRQLEDLHASKNQSSATIDDEIMATKKLRIKEENFDVLTDEFRHCMDQIAKNLGDFNEQLVSARDGDILTSITQPPPMFRSDHVKDDDKVRCSDSRLS